MSLDNTFVVKVRCPMCNRDASATGQIGWGQLVSTVYHLGDKIIWDESGAQDLAKRDPAAFQILKNYGYVAGNKCPRLLYQSWAECLECKKTREDASFGILIEVREDVIVAAYSALSDEQSKQFLADTSSGKVAIAVAGKLPDVHEQIATLALFNRALIPQIGSQVQEPGGVVYLRALGDLMIYWALASARPNARLIALDESAIREAMGFVTAQISGGTPELIAEARQILEEASRVENESRKIREIQP